MSTIITKTGQKLYNLDSSITNNNSDYRFRKWKRESFYFQERFKSACQLLPTQPEFLPDLKLSKFLTNHLVNLCEKQYKYLFNCSPFLEFSHDLEGNFKLNKAFFCRSRFCPLCNWRRRLKLGNRFSSYLQERIEDYQILFFTFTLPNCGIASLRQYMDILTDAYNILFGVGKINGYLKSKGGLIGKKLHLGSFRNIEITRRPTGFFCSDNEEAEETEENLTYLPWFYDYHPHLHAIVLFPRGSEQIPHNQFSTGGDRNWVSLWAKALLKAGLSYPRFEEGLKTCDRFKLPSMRVRTVSDGIFFDSDEQLKSTDTVDKNFKNNEKVILSPEQKLKKNIYETCKYGFDVTKLTPIRLKSGDIYERFIKRHSDYPFSIEAHFAYLAYSVYNYRLLSTYGELRGTVDENDEDLIHINENEKSMIKSNRKLTFTWNNQYQDFVTDYLPPILKQKARSYF